jgi:hypothetical protein
MVDTVEVTDAAATPVPASIPLPDSPIRQERWWQVYNRLARPTLDWVGVMGGAWSLFLGDWARNPMDAGNRVIVLGFLAALFGIRSWEKIKGVA